MTEWQGVYNPDTPDPIAPTDYLFYRLPKINPMPWWKVVLSRFGLIHPTQKCVGFYRTVATQDGDIRVYTWELVD